MRKNTLAIQAPGNAEETPPFQRRTNCQPRLCIVIDWGTSRRFAWRIGQRSETPTDGTELHNTWLGETKEPPEQENITYDMLKPIKVMRGQNQRLDRLRLAGGGIHVNETGKPNPAYIMIA